MDATTSALLRMSSATVWCQTRLPPLVHNGTGVLHGAVCSSPDLTAQLRAAIKTHRDTWVTEADFAFMASIGVNSVRLPLGYWVLAQTQARVLPPCTVPRPRLGSLPAVCTSVIADMSGHVSAKDERWQ